LNSQLRRPDTPETQLLWAIKHGNIDNAKAILENRAASQNVLQHLEQRFPTLADLTAIHVGQLESTAQANWDLGQLLSIIAKQESRFSRLAQLPADFFTPERCQYIACLYYDHEGDFAIHNDQVAREMAKNQHLPAAAYEVLATHNDQEVRVQIAKNPSIPASLLEELLNEREKPWHRNPMAVCVAAASNPSNSIEYLNKFIQGIVQGKKENFYMLLSVVTNQKLELSERLEGIKELIEHSDKNIDLFLANYIDTPNEILETIYTRYGQQELAILRAIMKHPNTPSAVLEKQFWNEKKEPSIYGWELAHPNIPSELLERFYRGYDETYQKIIARADTILAQRGWHTYKYDEVYRHAIASNPKIPRHIAEFLTRHASQETRVYLAKNPHIPNELFAVLAQHDTNVKAALASNPNTPLAVLDVLCLEQDTSILNGLAQNPNTPMVVLEQLAKQEMAGILTNTNITENMLLEYTTARLKRVSQFKNDPGIALAFLHPQCAPILLTKVAKRKEALFRVMVALHPNTPEKTLKNLTQDSDARVRGAAASRVAAVST
jgi:hypothetical protein